MRVLSRDFRAILNIMVHKVKRSEWHFIQLLSFSNFIHYYPEIFIELNDIIVFRNKSMEKPLRELYTGIVDRVSNGIYTSKKNAFDAGQLYGRLNNLYVEAFNYTKVRFSNTSGGPRSFIKGIEDNSTFYYFNEFRIFDNVLSQEFDLSEIELAFRQILSLNVTEKSWFVHEMIRVNYKIFSSKK